MAGAGRGGKEGIDSSRRAKGGADPAAGAVSEARGDDAGSDDTRRTDGGDASVAAAVVASGAK